MQLDYTFRPVLVKKISYVTHKGKKPNFQRPEHVHGPLMHEIIYLDYGRIVLRIDGQTMVLNAGDCVIIPGAAKHTFAGERGTPFDFLNIIFGGKPPAKLCGVKLPATAKTGELLKQLKRESEEELPHYREAIACTLTQLLIAFLRQLEVVIPHRLPESAIHHRYRSDLVKRALTVIEHKYSTRLGLAQLSRAVGSSESYLRALLKAETGENFSTILQKQRIAAAKHLLRDSTYTMEEIAGAIGYYSLPFFFKVFKRRTGMTPMAYSRSLGDPVE
jgi:AraC-like DNA-binding protein/mannose-6-phosphate isomerase-like protein (cupin superfamily)